jgi:RNA recognition motif-containing protein
VTEPCYAYVDYTTGVEFAWNTATNAWAPKNYSTDVKTPAKPEKQPQPQKDKKDKEWFQIDEDKNTNVYVSGMPFDMTDVEFEEMMGKYGIIMKDPQTNRLKIKLYRDEDGEVKGDGRCCYLMPEV